ncbi:MAG: DinB family protein [Acidimicrobiales bacterium]
MSEALGARSEERDLLGGFLEWYRAVVTHKVDGLSLDQASRVMTPTGLSPLGIVKHLALVERDWFRWTFAGEDVELPDVGEDNAPTFTIEPGDTVDAVLKMYGDDSRQAQRITEAAPSMDTLSVREASWYGHVTLRWVLVHMLEETARHVGHLDVMREHIDGTTGD